MHLQRRLARLGRETSSFDTDEISEIQQLENLHRVRAQFFCVQINLDSPAPVLQIDEMAFAHVAVRGDPARYAKIRALGKFFPHLRDITGSLERRPKRRDTQLFQRRQFFPPQRQQLTLVLFHPRDRF